MFGEYSRVPDLNDTFELRASTNAQFSKQEQASIERFDVRHNTTDDFSLP